jgi:hypothetical protein
MHACPASLRRLWALTGHMPIEGGAALSAHFEEVGLFLHLPLQPGGYDCSPSNALMFARTGGDGVHFALLPLDGMLSEETPVVLTVPMAAAGSTNFIVGENLQDFLALGCRRGYFQLEQLAYRPDSLLRELADPDFSATVSSNAEALLNALTAEFGLSPWGSEVAARLERLREKYLPLLALPFES